MIINVALPCSPALLTAANTPLAPVNELYTSLVPTLYTPANAILYWLIVPVIGKAALVNATLAGVAAKVPELIPTLATVATSCATTKYWIAPAENVALPLSKE